MIFLVSEIHNDVKGGCKKKDLLLPRIAVGQLEFMYLLVSEVAGYNDLRCYLGNITIL